VVAPPGPIRPCRPRIESDRAWFRQGIEGEGLSGIIALGLASGIIALGLASGIIALGLASGIIALGLEVEPLEAGWVQAATTRTRAIKSGAIHEYRCRGRRMVILRVCIAPSATVAKLRDRPMTGP
jgi:hypothetical protein